MRKAKRFFSVFLSVLLAFVVMFTTTIQSLADDMPSMEFTSEEVITSDVDIPVGDAIIEDSEESSEEISEDVIGGEEPEYGDEIRYEGEFEYLNYSYWIETDNWEIYEDDKVQFSVYNGEHLSDIVWTSSDTEIGVMDDNGMFTALSAGVTDIHFTSAEGISSWITITVKENVPFYTYGNEFVVPVGGECLFNIVRRGTDIENIHAVSSDETVARIIGVDENGVRLEAISKGEAIITIFSGDYSVDVNVKFFEATFSIDRSKIKVGDKAYLNFESNDVSLIRYGSSDSDVASVDEYGVVTAHKTGWVGLYAENSANNTICIWVEVYDTECIKTSLWYEDEFSISVNSSCLFSCEKTPGVGELYVTFDDDSIAEAELIDNQWKIVGMTPGSTIMHVTDGVVTTDVPIFVYTAMLATDCKNNTLSVGEQTQLYVDGNIKVKSVRYSSDSDCVNIDENGLITAISEGTAEISCNINDGQYYSGLTLRVISGSGIYVECPREFVIDDNNYGYSIYSDEPVSVYSDDANVMEAYKSTTDEVLVVRAKNPGKTVLHLAKDNGEEYSFAVTVHDIRVHVSSDVYEVGSVIDISVESSEEIAPFKWDSYDRNVVDVNEKGELVAVGSGYGSVYAMINGVSANASIRVIAPNEMMIANNTYHVPVNGGIGYHLTYISNDEDIVITVADESIAEAYLSEENYVIVNGLNPGETEVTVSRGDFELKIKVFVHGLKLIADSNEIKVGDTIKCEIVTDSEYTKAVWSTDNARVARVDQNGNITGIAVGKTWIRCVVDGMFVSIMITVNPASGLYTDIDTDYAITNCGRSFEIWSDSAVSTYIEDANIAEVTIIDQGRYLVVSARNPGETIIHVTNENGIENTYPIKVHDIRIRPEYETYQTGDTVKIIVESAEELSEYSWINESTEVLKDTVDGEFKAVGTEWGYVYSEINGIYAGVSIHVIEEDALFTYTNSVSLANSDSEEWCYVGKAYSNTKDIAVAVADESIVTAYMNEESLVVKGVSVGQTTITLTCGSYELTLPVTVYNIHLVTNADKIAVGDTFRLSVESDAPYNDFYWNDFEGLTLVDSEEGLFRADKVGYAYASACVDGKYVYTNIQVYPDSVVYFEIYCDMQKEWDCYRELLTDHSIDELSVKVDDESIATAEIGMDDEGWKYIVIHTIKAGETTVHIYAEDGEFAQDIRVRDVKVYADKPYLKPGDSFNIIVEGSEELTELNWQLEEGKMVKNADGSITVLAADSYWLWTMAEEGFDVTAELVVSDEYVIHLVGTEDEEWESVTASYDEVFTLPTNTFTRPGYVFAGWNTAEDGSGVSYQDKAQITVSEALEWHELWLFAQWKKEAVQPGTFSLSNFDEKLIVPGKDCVLTWNGSENAGYYKYSLWDKTANKSAVGSTRVEKELRQATIPGSKLISGHSYDLYVVAYDETGTKSSKVSKTFKVSEALTPGAFILSGFSENSIVPGKDYKISWTESVNAGYYKYSLWDKTANKSAVSSTIVEKNTRTATIPGSKLIGGHSYDLYVVAYNASGTKSSKVTKTFKVSEAVQPGTFTLKDFNDSKIVAGKDYTLEWTESLNVDHYKYSLWDKTANKSAVGSTVVEKNTRTATMPGSKLVAGHSYDLYVVAYNANESKSAKIAKTFKVSELVTPGAFSLTGFNENSIVPEKDYKISWTESANAGYYKYSLWDKTANKSAVGSTRVECDTKTVTLPGSKLIKGHSYDLYVVAYDVTGQKSSKIIKTFTVNETVQPGAFALIDFNSGEIVAGKDYEISWSESSNVDHYKYSLWDKTAKKSAVGSTKLSGDTQKVTIEGSKLISGHSYDLYVVAYDSIETKTSKITKTFTVK